ncbi:MAG: protein kinase [Phycisphaerae bacterium]
MCARSRMELIARVADAVHYAHERGIIHRDLKPANVLVTINDGYEASHEPITALECGVSEACRARYQCAGQPKILDFGVARLTDADLKLVTMHTEVGQLVGTLSYMSPEQAAGRSGVLDRRCDVYSLGMMLYELLAGRPPYDLRRRSISEAARIVREDEPSLLGSIDSQYRGDIETIVAKALTKEPEQRYPTAAALAADIRRLLRHEPIVARPLSSFYQARKFARRNKGLVGGVITAVICLVAGLFSTSWFALREVRAHRNADQALYHASLAAAGAALRESDIAAAEQHLLAAPRQLRGWEWDHLFSRLDQSMGSVAFDQHLTRPAGQVSRGWAQVWFSDDNRQVHVAQYYVQDQRLECAAWEAETLEQRSAWFVSDARVFAPLVGGTTLMALADEQIRLYDAANGELHDAIKLLPTERERLLIRSAMPKGIIDAGEQNFPLVRLRPNEFVVFSADGRRACRAAGAHVSIDDLSRDATPIVLEPHVEGINDAVFTRDNRYLITAGNDRRLACFDLDRGGLRVWQRPNAHRDAIMAVAASPDGTTLATGGQDRVLRLWEAKTGESRGTLVGHRAPILDVAFNDDGSQLVSCAFSRLYMWETVAASDPDVLRGHTSFVRSLAVSPDGALLASGSQELRLWDARTGALVFELAGGPQGAFLRLSFSTDGQRLLAVRDAVVDNAHRPCGLVLDVRSGEVVHSFDEPDAGFVSARFNSGGQLIIQNRNVLQVLDAHTYAPVRSVELATTYSDFELAGERMAVVSPGEQRVFDLPSLTVRRTWTHKSNLIHFLIQNGAMLVLPRSDNGIALLDVTTGRERGVLHGHTGKVTCFSEWPQHNLLISGADDRTVRVWDLKSMEELCVLRGHDDKIWALAVTPDGETIYSASGDYTIRRWNMRPLRDLLRARDQYRHTQQRLQPLVISLFEQLRDARAVADRIEQDNSLTDRERQIALQLVLAQSSTHSNH